MAGPYRLGVDLGTTYTAAAIERDGKVEVCTLGDRTATIPSLALVRPSGEIVVGEAAARRAAIEPFAVAREFKRRLGDPAPLVLGGVSVQPEALMAALLRHVMDLVTTQEDRPPERVVLSHPANFGPYKTGLMRSVARLADVGDIDLVPEPQAAAISYARRSVIEPGKVVAVYDFGGGTFDAALVRRTADGGFEIVGQPEGIDRLGGIDIDQLLVDQVLDSSGASAVLDGDVDEATLSALVELRDRCQAAKEALSVDPDTRIPVNLGGVATSVRVTREQFAELVQPRVMETVEALQRAIRNSSLSTADIDRVLLVGGSSRIPLVADTLRATLHRPVALDANPKTAICQGAALLMASRESSAPLIPGGAGVVGAAAAMPPPPPPASTPPSSPVTPPPGAPAFVRPPPPPTGPPAAPPPDVPPPPTSPTGPPLPEPAPSGGHGGRRRGLLIGVVCAVVVAAIVALVIVLAGGDDTKTSTSTDSVVVTNPADETVATSDPTEATTIDAPTTTITATVTQVGKTVYFAGFQIDIATATFTPNEFAGANGELVLEGTGTNLSDGEASLGFIAIEAPVTLLVDGLSNSLDVTAGDVPPGSKGKLKLTARLPEFDPDVTVVDFGGTRFNGSTMPLGPGDVTTTVPTEQALSGSVTTPSQLTVTLTDAVITPFSPMAGGSGSVTPAAAGELFIGISAHVTLDGASSDKVVEPVLLRPDGTTDAVFDSDTKLVDPGGQTDDFYVFKIPDAVAGDYVLRVRTISDDTRSEIPFTLT